MADLDAAIETFISEFKLSRDDLFDESIFTTEDLDNLRAKPLSDTPVDPVSLLDLLTAHQPTGIMSDVTEDHTTEDSTMIHQPGIIVASEAPGTWDVAPEEVTELAGLVGILEPAARALAALKAGMHVIFTGPPGTGKTRLAAAVCQKAGFPSWTVPATDQWTTFDTIGGYFPTPSSTGEGGMERLDFLPGAVVDSIIKGRCLIVDEINRADIDKAFGELFTLLTGNTVTLPYRRRTGDGDFKRIRLQFNVGVMEEGVDVIPVPEWWRILGAMNDADKASLKRLSLAFIRRFAFVPVPLPSAADYETILRSQAGKGNKAVNLICEVLVSLFGGASSALAKIGLPIGPAIPLAMLRQATTEFEMNETRNHSQVLSSLLELYLAPQVQGRADLHEAVVKTVSDHLTEGAEDFAKVLSVWTGVSNV